MVFAWRATSSVALDERFDVVAQAPVVGRVGEPAVGLVGHPSMLAAGATGPAVGSRVGLPRAGRAVAGVDQQLAELLEVAVAGLGGVDEVAEDLDEAARAPRRAGSGPTSSKISRRLPGMASWAVVGVARRG